MEIHVWWLEKKTSIQTQTKIKIVGEYLKKHIICSSFIDVWKMVCHYWLNNTVFCVLVQHHQMILIRFVVWAFFYSQSSFWSAKKSMDSEHDVVIKLLNSATIPNTELMTNLCSIIYFAIHSKVAEFKIYRKTVGNASLLLHCINDNVTKR